MKFVVAFFACSLFFTLQSVQAAGQQGMDMTMPMGAATKKVAQTLPKGANKKARVLPKIAISTSVEDGKKMLVATVTLGKKPVANAKVEFFVQRTFGRLSIGSDETLDDGTAAIAFPLELPGGMFGELNVAAQVTQPGKYAGAQTTAVLPTTAVVQPDPDPFPGALWSRRPPLALVLTIVILLSGVWSTYSYVIVQLRKIRKGEKA